MYYETPTPPQPENTGREIWKVMRLQLGIFLGYQLLLAVAMSLLHGGFLIIDIFPLVIHWLILFIFMIVNFASKKNGAGLGYLLSLLIIVIVGFGSCWGISGIVDKGMMF